jgi:hypothetical protein
MEVHRDEKRLLIIPKTVSDWVESGHWCFRTDERPIVVYYRSLSSNRENLMPFQMRFWFLEDDS